MTKEQMTRMTQDSDPLAREFDRADKKGTVDPPAEVVERYCTPELDPGTLGEHDRPYRLSEGISVTGTVVRLPTERTFFGSSLVIWTGTRVRLVKVTSSLAGSLNYYQVTAGDRVRITSLGFRPSPGGEHVYSAYAIEVLQPAQTREAVTA